MPYLTGSRSRWLLAIVIVATALAGCMTPQVAPAPPAPQADEQVVTMYVGPVQADCVGVGPQKCLLVKEGSTDGPYLMFYSNIAGFEWEEGYNYELRVRKTNVDNPPADASSINYELVEVVNKTPAGEVSTLYVAPMMVECETTQIYKCLLVSDSPDGEYRPFYGKINGLDYEEGYQYALLVEAVPMAQPPADAPAGVWNLLAVTQKTPASTVAAPQLMTPLEGTLWTMTSYLDANGQVQPALEGSKVTATFQDGRAVGSAGCNNYTAEYTLDGNTLTIGPAATTLMACISEELSAQEAAYLGALGTVASYETSGEALRLMDASGQTVLEFAATAPTTLISTIWQVVSYNNGKQAVVSLLADTELTMVFDEEGRVSGTSGCNNYTGGYTVDGDAIQIGPLASTMMMCAAPEGVMEQEQRFQAALQAATTYSISGDRLELRDDSGALQVNAVATAPAAEAPAASEAAPLESTPWVLTSYVNAENQTIEPIEGIQVTAVFADGRVSGNASCNNYSAEYTVDGSTMQIGIAITTMMMCQPQEVADQEQAFLAALSTVASYQIEGQTLTLADADGQVVLAFEALQPASLTGTNWQIGFYNNGKQALVTPIAGTSITMLFVEDGNVSGNTGCNNYTGGYALEGDQLTIGPLATTRMFCADPEGVMDQETAFLAALQSVVTFKITGEDLEMYDADGARALTASAQTLALAAGGNPEELTGRTWLWQGTTYTDGTSLQAEDATAYTLELLPDGSALVRADCNSLAGAYTIAEDGGITIELPTEGLSTCSESSLASEYLNDLNRSVVYSLADGALYLDLADEAGSMEFAEAGAMVVAPVGEVAPTPAESDMLTGQLWGWQSLDMSDGSITTVENPEQYTVEFMQDGTLGVLADCNVARGAYTAENGSMTIEVGAMTLMACPPDSMSDMFLARLNDVASYVIDGGQLYLNLKFDSGNMVFAPLSTAPERAAEPTPAPAPEELAPPPTQAPSVIGAGLVVGPTWQWVGFQDGAERYAVSEPSRYTVTLLADGKYQIVADCNTGTGSYTLDGRQLSIGPAAMTRMACPPDSQDTAFLSNLGAAEAVFVTGNSMYVETDTGAIMKFNKAQ